MESSSKPTRLWGMYSSLAVVACTAFPCISCCRSGVIIREFLSDSGRFTVKRISGAPCKSAAHPCKTWSFQPCSNNLAAEGGPKLDLFLTHQDANPVGLGLAELLSYWISLWTVHINMYSMIRFPISTCYPAESNDSTCIPATYNFKNLRQINWADWSALSNAHHHFPSCTLHVQHRVPHLW